MRRRSLAALLVAVLVVAVRPAAAAPDDMDPQFASLYALLGQPAPDFTLDAVDAGTVTLAEHLKAHQVIIVQFWATWCGPCTVETLIYNVLRARVNSDDLVILGLHAGEFGAPRIPEMRAELGMDYPVAIAPDSLWEAYGSSPVLPTSFVIDRSGHVRHVKLGIEWVDDLEPMVRELLNETPDEAAAAVARGETYLWAGPQRHGGPEAAASPSAPEPTVLDEAAGAATQPAEETP